MKPNVLIDEGSDNQSKSLTDETDSGSSEDKSSKVYCLYLVSCILVNLHSTYLLYRLNYMVYCARQKHDCAENVQCHLLLNLLCCLANFVSCGALCGTSC